MDVAPTVQDRSHLFHGTFSLGSWPRRVLVVTAIAISLIPLVHMTRLLATTGANNPGNDYIDYIDIIDWGLSGGYNWLNFFRDTSLQGHVTPIPTLTWLVAAHVTDMNEFSIIFFGLVLTIIRLLLVYDILTYWTSHWGKYLVLPALSFLTFGTAQFSALGFGEGTPVINWCLLGFCLGLWGIVRFPRRWTGVAWAIGGGAMSAWSAGYGIAAWPTLFLALLLFQFRKLRFYFVWFVAGVIVALPYIEFRSVTSEFGETTATFSLQRFHLIPRNIGSPFAPINMPAALEAVGLIAIAVAIVGCALAVLVQKPKRRFAYPAMLLIVFSLIVSYTISFGRTGVANWYPALMLPFWYGVLGLAFALVVPADGHVERPINEPASEPWPASRLRRLPGLLWSGGVLLWIGSLYLATNFTYIDKSYWLWVRRPVSASCILYFQTAPSYCEGYLFQWPIGRPWMVAHLAEPLARHRISTFAPHQQWALQGDFGLENVRITESNQVPDTNWSLDESGGSGLSRTSWNDFRHLNLFLHSPNEIRWTVHIPPNVQTAELQTAVAISESVPTDNNGDGLVATVSVQVDNGEPQLLFAHMLEPDAHDWYPVSLPLDLYAGHQVTLVIASNVLANPRGDWLMFRYPVIDITIDETQGTTTPLLDLQEIGPAPDDDDLQIDLSQWNQVNMRPSSAANAWAIQARDAFVYGTGRVCLSDYSHFYVRLAAPPSITRQRYLRIAYVMGPPEEWTRQRLSDALSRGQERRVEIPLHTDGDIHEYTYPIRLLELDDPVVIPFLMLMPVRGGQNTTVTIEDFRLIRDDQTSSRCST